MKNDVLLNRLVLLSEKYNLNGVYPELDDMIQDVKIEVYADTKQFTSSKKAANKKALAFLKKAGKGPREVLGYTDVQNGYQVFTDAYTAFKLKEFMELPTIPADEVKAYPYVEKLFPNADDMQLIAFDLNDFLKKLKAKMYEYDENRKTYYVSLSDDKSVVWLDAKKVKSVIDILGTTVLKVYIRAYNSPVLFVDEVTGNEAIICPIRRDI